MKNLPKITIIIPCLNQGQYIGHTIKSILKQNYSNLELIIIDGGSKDNTLEIIKKHEDHITYWVSEKDEGQTDAINKGLLIATGDIVNWVNSDDYMGWNSLNYLAKYYYKYPKGDVFFGKCHLVDQNSNILKIRNVKPFSLSALSNRAATLVQPAVFFKKSCIDKLGLLDSSLQYVMDQELYFRMATAKLQFIKIPHTIAFFRHQPLSKTLNYRKDFFRELEIVESYPRNKRSFFFPKKTVWIYYKTIRKLNQLPGLLYLKYLRFTNGQKLSTERFEEIQRRRYTI